MNTPYNNLYHKITYQTYKTADFISVDKGKNSSNNFHNDNDQQYKSVLREGTKQLQTHKIMPCLGVCVY